MTGFSFPVQIKRLEEGTLVGSTTPSQLAAARRANVRSQYSVKVSAGDTGLGAGGTTIPLFIAPAGARFFTSHIDVLTAFDNTAGVSVQVGIPANPATIMAQTTVNTVGRRDMTQTGATVSVNAIPLTVDTTVKAIVSITTSAITVGDMIIHVVMY